jgi:iron complex transport system substrate-binding protein
MARIVSLDPGTSEFMMLMGQAHHMAGRSHACDYPEGLSKFPIVTSPKPRGPLGPEIPEGNDPRELLAACLSPYRADLDAIKAIDPDYLITRFDLIDTPFTAEQVKAAVRTVLGTDVRLMELPSADLNSLQNEHLKQADMFGAGKEAKQLFDKMKQRMEQIYEQAKNAPARKRAIVIERLTPLTSAGRWVPRLLESAYVEPLLAAHGEPSRRITWEQVIAAKPDLLILALADAPLKEAFAQIQELQQMPEFRTLKCFRAKQVFMVDGTQHILRGGPRLLESTELIAEFTYTQLFGKKHLGNGWYEL